MTTPAERAQDVLQALYILLRTTITYEDHPLTRDAAERLFAHLDHGQDPWSIQFIRGAAFQDRTLLELSDEQYWRAAALAKTLNHLGAHEVTIAPHSTVDEWLRFAEALATGYNGPGDALRTMRLPHLSWRAIPNADWGSEDEELEPEMFAITQIALALRDAPLLTEQMERMWPWATAISILSRIMRASEAHRRATRRALEFAPGGWSVERRALSAAFQALCIMQDLEIPADQQLVGGHVVLALTIHGLQERDGLPVSEAATLAAEHLSADLARVAASGAPRHHMRTCAALQQLVHRPSSSWLPLLHLGIILYDLERHRCPAGRPFDLTLVDLLAHASREMGTLYGPVWVKALIRAHDTYPPGAHVRLPDGRAGVVISEDDEGVEVFIAGQSLYMPGDPKLQLVSTFDAMMESIF